MTDYLTVAEVLAIHDDQIDQYGGAHGLRDQGQLEAAIFRPQTGYYVDVVAEAAALSFGSINEPRYGEEGGNGLRLPRSSDLRSA